MRKTLTGMTIGVRELKRRSVAAVALVTAAVVLGGCMSIGGGERYSDEEAARRTAILMARPSLEEMIVRAEAMGHEIRSAISSAVPVGPWRQSRPPSSAGNCDGFSYTYGQGWSIGFWVIDGGIPEELWPGALAAMRSVTDRHGFGDPIVVVDRPGDHDLRIYGPDDAYVVLGTRNDALLDVVTACYLPEARRPGPGSDSGTK